MLEDYDHINVDRRDRDESVSTILTIAGAVVGAVVVVVVVVFAA